MTDLGPAAGAGWDLYNTDVNSAGTVVGAGGDVTSVAEGWPNIEWSPVRSHDGKLEKLPVPTGSYNVHARRRTGTSTATALPNGQGTTAVNRQGLILGSNKKLVPSLWQLTTSAGAAPSDGRLITLGDDGTLAGEKARPGTTFPRFPAIWRCG